MARASVQDILREIEALSEEDRLALEQQLAGRMQEQWQREVGTAREGESNGDAASELCVRLSRSTATHGEDARATIRGVPRPACPSITLR